MTASERGSDSTAERERSAHDAKSSATANPEANASANAEPHSDDALRDLHALLEERQRYEQWLTALDERKSSAAPHVYQRVHADYTARLDRVMQRLAEQTEQLQATVSVMTSRLRGLQERETDRTEVRQEAELRALVGEYTEEEWSNLRDEADLEIALIVEEREKVERDVTELQRIIALTSAPSKGTTAPASAAAPADVSSNAVSGTAAPVPPPPAPDREPLIPISDLFAEPIITSTPVPAPQGDGTPRAPEVEAPRTRSSTPSTPTVPPLRTVTRLDATVEPRRGEHDKTLKCPECGTMNYATEWYCERCGGELATF